MKILKFVAALTLGASVAACGNMPDIASRNAPFEATPPRATASVNTSVSRSAASPTTGQNIALDRSPLSLAAVQVNVPRSLRVSEANGYYPNAEIVWRGDPIGDRYQQVAEIFETATRRGTTDMTGSTGVILDVEVLRFHSVTEKTRYSVGGVHNMKFNITVRRASTGQALAPTRMIEANLPALGGRAAIEADRMGQTQKVRVTGFLEQAIRQELARFIPA